MEIEAAVKEGPHQRWEDQEFPQAGRSLAVTEEDSGPVVTNITLDWKNVVAINAQSKSNVSPGFTKRSLVAMKINVKINVNQCC